MANLFVGTQIHEGLCNMIFLFKRCSCSNSVSDSGGVSVSFEAGEPPEVRGEMEGFLK